MVSFRNLMLLLSLALSIGVQLNGQSVSNDVKIIGAMRDVMWKGQLQGNISLDSLASSENLYGLGPVEGLTGEVIIINGKAYRSFVDSNGTMATEETFNIKAPFFSYANIKTWTEIRLPDTIKTAHDLERFLDQLGKGKEEPFLFKISGMIESGEIHIVDLPEGVEVQSPEDVHRHSKKYRLQTSAVDIVGFFSRKHQSIFTHHDTYLHMHLITEDRKILGHVDSIAFRKGNTKVYLP